MRRYLILLIFNSFALSINAQESHNILRCEIKSTRVKVPMTDGTLSDWRPLGNHDEKMLTKIVFDFNKMKMYWDVKARNNDKNYEGGIVEYIITEFSKDSTYADFGFTSYKLKCLTDKKETVDYELIEFSSADCYYLSLISNDKDMKMKQDLILQ